MLLKAVSQLRKMRGGAQSHLMAASDGHAYVVKFQNNPQHPRVLANEMIASRLASALGLTVAHCEAIEVPEALIESTPALELVVEGGLEQRCRAGRQFGSRFVGGVMPGRTVDYLTEPDLLKTINLIEFAGILVLDKWTCNTDGRQAVFYKQAYHKRYKATFIDQGNCFGAGEWVLTDTPLRGVYARNLVYLNVRGWSSFEPWMERMRQLDPQVVWEIADRVPPEWYGNMKSDLEALVESLLRRKERVSESIELFRKSSRKPFPNWM